MRNSKYVELKEAKLIVNETIKSLIDTIKKKFEYGTKERKITKEIRIYRDGILEKLSEIAS